MIDIEILRIIWWLLIGVLFMGFAITDGYDLGIGILLPLVSRTETERLIVRKTFTPVWEGNQVWIILAAGALFAAWPYVYAVAFSGAYIAVLLLLLTLGIARPVSIKYRNKMPSMAWRYSWDFILFIGGLFPAIIFGVLVGNVMLGLPFTFDDMLRINYSGRLLDLFHPFALYCGLTSLFMLMMHSGIYLAVKTEAPIRDRAIYWARLSGMMLIILFALGGVWVAKLNGYHIISGADPFGPSNPMHKIVAIKEGVMLANYFLYPYAIIIPLLGFFGAFMAIFTVRHYSKIAFVFSSLSIMGIIGTVGISLFPFILPSSSNPNASLLVWDASSSQLTLLLMLVATIVFLPIVLLYTAWVFRVMRGKVTQPMIERDDKHPTSY